MPAHRGGDDALFSLKEIVIAPANAARGLDPHQGAVLLHDGDDRRAAGGRQRVRDHRDPHGRRLCGRDQAPRPAGSAACRDPRLGRPGTLARSRRCAPSLDDPELRVWSRTPAHAEALALESHAVVVRDGRGGARRRGDRLHLHVRARARSSGGRGSHRARTSTPSGSSVPSARELEADVVAAASLFVDRRESTLNESGDYLRAVEEAGIGPEHIRAELGELLVGGAPRSPGRRRADALQVARPRRRGSRRSRALRRARPRARYRGRGDVLIPLDGDRAGARADERRHRRRARSSGSRSTHRARSGSSSSASSRSAASSSAARRARSGRPTPPSGATASGRRAPGTWRRASAGSPASSACRRPSSRPTTRRARSSTPSSGSADGSSPSRSTAGGSRWRRARTPASTGSSSIRCSTSG